MENYDDFDEPVEVNVERPVGVVISIRLSAEEAHLLFAVARDRDKGAVEVAKEATLAYIRSVAAESARR